MRKISLIFMAMLLGSTAALADGDWYHRHYHGGGGGGNNWALPLIGGVIIGGMLGSMNRDRRVQDYEFNDQPQFVCRWVDTYDAFGNWMGRQRRCFQRY